MKIRRMKLNGFIHQFLFGILRIVLVIMMFFIYTILDIGSLYLFIIPFLVLFILMGLINHFLRSILPTYTAFLLLLPAKRISLVSSLIARRLFEIDNFILILVGILFFNINGGVYFLLIFALLEIIIILLATTAQQLIVNRFRPIFMSSLIVVGMGLFYFLGYTLKENFAYFLNQSYLLIIALIIMTCYIYIINFYVLKYSFQNLKSK